MLDETGFKRQRFSDLFEEMEVKAKESFGEDKNTSARSPLGILLRLFAWFLSLLWSKTEDVYNAAYVNTAQGINLDRIAPYVGITRIAEQPAKGTISINGEPNKTIPTGFVVATASETFFKTIKDVTLDNSGAGSVTIEAVHPGVKGNVSAVTITEIVNPTPDITSITNIAPTTGGRERETDNEFRERFKQSVSGGGAATLDALRGALLRINGVRAASVVENTSMNTDAEGRPPKSFQAYVLGGDPDDIARTIFDTKSAGVESHGDVVREVIDLAGQPHNVKYSTAVEIAIKAQVVITRNERYPLAGDAMVQTEIIRYIGGEDSDGIIYVGLNMGMDVVYNKLIGAIYKIDGVDDVALQIGTGDVLGTNNISIQLQQVAQTRFSDIGVTSHV